MPCVAKKPDTLKTLKNYKKGLTSHESVLYKGEELPHGENSFFPNLVISNFF